MPFPVELRFIKRAEEQLGRKLPPCYKLRLSRENGGAVKTSVDVWQLFPVFDDSDRTRLKRTCNHIVRETAQNRKWAGFPDDAVAIGANGGGDLLVFVPGDNPSRFDDKVYWWDHETGELLFVVDDFSELRET